MGKSVLASVKLSSVLSDIKPDDGYVLGLIIGQVTEKADYVAHLARTPASLTGSVPVDSPSQLQDSWLGEHVKNVMPLLPGGMIVVGIYVVGPSDMLSSDVDSSKLISLVNRVRKLSPIPAGSSSKHLILAFNSKTKKFACKSVTGDTLTASLCPVEWKFQNKSIEWFIAEMSLNLGSVGGSVGIQRDDAKKTVKANVDVVLENARNMINESSSSVNNSFRGGDERLADLKKKIEVEKSKESNNQKPKKPGPFVFKVDLFSSPLIVRKLSSGEKSAGNVVFDLKFAGHSFSRVYMHENATVSETVEYLKRDAIKSLETRFQMYWDSSDNLTMNESVHQVHHPPKRVMYHDPNSGIAFSDYMFIDDTEDDIMTNLEEQLGLTVDPKNLTTFYEIHKLRDVPKENDDKKVDDEEVEEDDEMPPKPEKPTISRSPLSQTTVITGISVAAVILLLALLLQFLM